jgi:hypothetical protein
VPPWCTMRAVFHRVENVVDNGGRGGDNAAALATCENERVVKPDASTSYPTAVHSARGVDDVWMGESPVCGQPWTSGQLAEIVPHAPCTRLSGGPACG